MLSVGICSLFLLQVQITASSSLPWPLESDTGCYGNTADDYLSPQCNLTGPSVMVVGKVYAMAKELKTNCSQTATSTDRDEEKCCTVAEEDCKMNYDSSTVFYSNCMGRPSCSVNVAWMTTSCNHTDYLPRSNYMLMDYYCIPTSLILNASDTEHRATSDRAVYIQNDRYPNISVIGGSCSVSSSCNTTIVISVIHLSLNNAGSCTQNINVRDESRNATIDCSSNNDADYAMNDIYISTSHFLILDFINVNAVSEGKLWIQIMGSNRNAKMDLRCGSQAESVPPVVDACPVDITSTTDLPTTVSGSTSSSSDRNTTTSEPDVLSRSDPDDGNLIPIIVTVVLLLILVVALIILCVRWKKKKQRENKVGDKTKPTDFPSEDAMVFGEDGLPVYLLGKTPKIISQILPVQTRLGSLSEKSSSADMNSGTTGKKPRVPSALKAFGEGQNKTPVVKGPLPQVRGAPPRPVSQDLAQGLAPHPFSVQAATAEGVGSPQANGNVVEEAQSTAHKKKKKKSASGTEEHSEKKKKKKKKHKRQEEDGEE